jgi:hypothetical protein
MKLLYEEIIAMDYSNASDKVKSIIGVMENAEIFRIQNVVDYYMSSTTQEIWDIRTDFPNLAPPFERFWMEYTVPHFLNSEGVIKINPNVGIRFGLLFEAVKTINKDWQVTISIFGQDHGSDPVNNLFVFILVNHDGKIEKIVGEHYSVIGCKQRNGENQETITETANAVLFPALLAISFLHCKNVKIINNNPIRGMRRNRHKPKIVYRTLEIEPMKKIMREEGQSETTGIKNALHICRGHFKDYTEGRGLFGLYRDIFWWDSQIRGHLEEGIVLKDYDIKEPKKP